MLRCAASASLKGRLPSRCIYPVSFSSLRHDVKHLSSSSLRWHAPAAAVASSSSTSNWQQQRPGDDARGGVVSSSTFATMAALLLAAASASGAMVLSTTTTTTAAASTEGMKKPPVEPHPGAAPMPCTAGNDDICDDAPSLEELPIYRSSYVARNDGTDGKPVWMSYGGVVYDATNFIPNHPGGSEKILMASGGALEPWWYIYRQHFATDLPLRMMEKMIVGRLDERDQAVIDMRMEKEMDEETDPYDADPVRHPKLRVHSDQPMNAEVPPNLLTATYLTPNELFYIRHHHPVPKLSEDELKDYSVDIDLSACGKGEQSVSLADLKKLDKVQVVTTMQCSGNRRGGFNEVGDRTSGTPWGQGAISTARWGGVRLRDVLNLAGMDDPIAAEGRGIEHVRFESLDGMTASIGIEKACNPYGDVILAYEMNGEPIPRDHGFPVRVIVPGYSAVRNVKWVKRIEVSEMEAEGPWQRGLNYKMLPPAVRDAGTIKLEEMPSMTEASLYSGITELKRIDSEGEEAKPVKAGDRVTMKATGWAWAGGGRNVVRVDITGDDGKSWSTANIVEGGDQKFGRAWAWVFWSCEVPAIVREDGQVELSSKSVDLAFNVQPESCAHSWNVRGLGNNSWFTTSATVL